MKIVIPILENRGRESRLSPHFGRAPYFAVYSTKTGKLEIFENRGGHFGGRGTPAQNMLKHGPDVVFALGMGPNAIELFAREGVRVETGDFKTVGDVIDNKEHLEKLEEGCKEHKH
jgi:predicted Fe-Mo cluster-binding NifX family protein